MKAPWKRFDLNGHVNHGFRSSYGSLTHKLELSFRIKVTLKSEFGFAPPKSNIYYMTVCTAEQVLFLASA